MTRLQWFEAFERTRERNKIQTVMFRRIHGHRGIELFGHIWGKHQSSRRAIKLNELALCSHKIRQLSLRRDSTRVIESLNQRVVKTNASESSWQWRPSKRSMASHQCDQRYQSDGQRNGHSQWFVCWRSLRSFLWAGPGTRAARSVGCGKRPSSLSRAVGAGCRRRKVRHPKRQWH